ncbi:MFS transporter [Inquilinus sp. Marseille-Q2685]|uniref:MFS transporter n=1 Tax=Inquilinus sp. Marseille-Q2685 TaxID=2866581 RepID=UPI001CE3D8AB|nr:MFS transporter [Inquilinus sp. Marseille-Q2685]
MAPSKRLDIQTFIDERPVGTFQWKVLALCLIVLVLDGFDVVAMGFIAPAIVTDWSVPREALAPVLSAGLFGLALGAMAGGLLADRFGRRRVILIAMFFFGAMSLVSAWAPDLFWLAVLRFLTGLGLGASQPNAATLVSEYAPERRRSLFVTVVYCGFTFGAAGGGFLSAGLVSTYGWPSILVLGGVVPVIIVAIYFFILPESPRFLAVRHERRDRLTSIVNQMAPGTADATTEFVIPEVVHRGTSAIRTIFSASYALPTLMLWVGLFMNLLTVYLLNSWLPIMIRDAGFSVIAAATIGAMMQIGGTLGNVSIGYGMDRWGPHVTLVAVLLAAALFAVLIWLTPGADPTVLGILVFLLGFCTNSSNTGWTALAALFYPTEARATGTSVMTGIGRFGAIFGATVGGMLLAAQFTFGQVFAFLALPLCLAILAALVKARCGIAGDRLRAGKVAA